MLNTQGIGGSETAVVHIAKRFAAAGWRADVYCGAERFEGIYDGVGYFDPERLKPGEKCDVFVSWRQPQAVDFPVDAKARLIWCHDLHNGPGVEQQLARFDRVLGVSDWHAGFLRQVYGLQNVDYVPNGIDLARFPEAKKVWGQAVWASSPDRGLERLLKMWPAITKGSEGPKLVVGYGWDNIDKRIQAGDGQFAAFKDRLTRLMAETPGVEFRGRLPQDELAKLYAESWFWPYPTSFLETSCIGAMEAMAGGCVPVCSSAGALKDTVGDGGYVVTGLPESRAWGPFFVNVARAVLFEMNTHKVGELKARARAQQFTWDASFARWESIVAEVLK